jgi:hypothetical protein
MFVLFPCALLAVARASELRVQYKQTACIHVAQNRVEWRDTFLNTAMNLDYMKGRVI